MHLVKWLSLAAALTGGMTSANECAKKFTWMPYDGNFQTLAAGWKGYVYCNEDKVLTACKFHNENDVKVAMIDSGETKACPLAPKYTCKCENKGTLIPSVSLTATAKCDQKFNWMPYDGSFQIAAARWKGYVYCNDKKLLTACKFHNENDVKVAMVEIGETRVCPLAPKYTCKCENKGTLIPSVSLTATVPCKAASPWQSYDKFIALGSGITAETNCDVHNQQTKCRFCKNGAILSTVVVGEHDTCAAGFTCSCHKEGSHAIPWLEPVKD